ncbi:hypothetical protein Ae717Ps2_6796 [Pseudonocardia sp. Ae717_Ps2]|nr:hypothetical protein Ae717Ps2_6796 [Pseudonocardia sp. Ae717_Ps2]
MLKRRASSIMTTPVTFALRFHVISVRPFPSGTGVPNSMVFRQQVVKRSSSSSKTGWTVPVLFRMRDVHHAAQLIPAEQGSLTHCARCCCHQPSDPAVADVVRIVGELVNALHWTGAAWRWCRVSWCRRQKRHSECGCHDDGQFPAPALHDNPQFRTTYCMIAVRQFWGLWR